MRTGAGNLRATQTARLKGQGGKLRRPMGGGGAKPVGWMQSSAARGDRLALGKERSREAAFLRSLPKETRRANRLASKTRNQVLGQRYRSAVNEGMTTLRSNFGKRKGLAPGAADSINKAIQTSGRKMRAALADPRPGRRLAKSRIGKERKPVALPRQSGVIAKSKSLKPQPGAKLKKELAFSRMREMNRRVADKPDMAQVNIPGRFTGQSGKRFAASIAKAASQAAALQRAQMLKPKDQVRAEAAARKATKEAAAAAKPKRTRTAESMRTSRAKRILKEREMKISGTYRQWENSKRVQDRALTIYADRARASKKRKR